MARQDGNAGGEIALILAAERLFAERGIEAVSLRQVNQAAQHRNISATHYHFGSKEGLVHAVLMYRLPELDGRRAELLARKTPCPDLRFYLECFIIPLADQLRAAQGGGAYLRFIQQYEKYCGDYDFVRTISPAGVTIFDGLERLLAFLPDEVRRFRMGHFINLVHAVFATVEDRLARGHLSDLDADLTATNLIDMLVGALNAPPSKHLFALIGDVAER